MRYGGQRRGVVRGKRATAWIRFRPPRTPCFTPHASAVLLSRRRISTPKLPGDTACFQISPEPRERKAPSAARKRLDCHTSAIMLEQLLIESIVAGFSLSVFCFACFQWHCLAAAHMGATWGRSRVRGQAQSTAETLMP